MECTQSKKRISGRPHGRLTCDGGRQSADQTRVRAPALTAEGEVRRGAHVTGLTGILKVTDGRPDSMCTMARTESLHPA